jgi:hypothetical protein
LKDRSDYHEKDVEQAIMDHLQQFLLELGRGVRHEVALESCLRESRRPFVSPNESRDMNKELSRQCDRRTTPERNREVTLFPATMVG